ncbi:MAG: endolytic transglycosylase MltG [Hydrogenophilus sp.]|nr:endolytic transglycosylase MltG [Hydrogenophilus sp.]
MRKVGWRHWIVAAVGAGAVGGAATWGGLLYWAEQPLPLAQPVEVQIQQGSGVLQAIVQVGEALGGPRWAWVWLGWWERPAVVRAGFYRFEAGTSPRGAVAKLATGAVIRERLTIVEGWTVRQMLAAVRAHPFIRQTIEGENEAELLAAIGAKVPYAEGWFFPDTYLFDRMSEDRTILAEAHSRMRAELAAAWAARAPDLPLASEEELLILASIVEKETAHPEDRAKVASVFINRLIRGMPLQADPTVIYGRGEERERSLSRADLARDTPFNTYTRKGLPPTPIALPGRAALWAAAQPAKTDFLYFVASGVDERSVFSRSLPEHQQAVQRYRAAVAGEGGEKR